MLQHGRVDRITLACGRNDVVGVDIVTNATRAAVDPSGQTALANALNSGTSRTQIAELIFNSPEFKADLVQNLYQQYLHRSPDPGGLQAFNQAAASGWSDEQLADAFAYLGSTVFTGYYLNYAQTDPDI